MRHFHLLIVLVVSSCAHRDGTRLESRAPGTQQRSGDIVLDLRTDQARYRVGDAVRVTATTDQRASLTIYSLDSTGRKTPVWPRAGMKPPPLNAGETLTLPPKGADWQILAGEPLGVNTLVAEAVSSPRPVPARPNGASSSPSGPEFFQMHTGGWKGLAVEPSTQAGSSTTSSKRGRGEARWLYEVKR